ILNIGSLPFYLKELIHLFCIFPSLFFCTFDIIVNNVFCSSFVKVSSKKEVCNANCASITVIYYYFHFSDNVIVFVLYFFFLTFYLFIFFMILYIIYNL